MTEILDLTKLLDERLPIYASGSYSDPPFQVETWCTVQQQGYAVSRLSLGTQTGTHIDAPAHFTPDGATLEALPVPVLIGPYLWIDLAHATPAGLTRLSSSYHGQSVLFLTSTASAEIAMEQNILDSLLELPCAVWVIAYSVQVTEQDALFFHHALAAAGKYLVEDLDEQTASKVRPGGQLIALPLRLVGVSGSPCRVVVIQD